MKRISLLMLLTILFFSCQQKEQKKTNVGIVDKTINETKIIPADVHKNDIAPEFSLYLENFGKMNLPVMIKGCEIEIDNLKELNGEKYIKYHY